MRRVAGLGVCLLLTRRLIRGGSGHPPPVGHRWRGVAWGIARSRMGHRRQSRFCFASTTGGAPEITRRTTATCRGWVGWGPCPHPDQPWPRSSRPQQTDGHRLQGRRICNQRCRHSRPGEGSELHRSRMWQGARAGHLLAAGTQPACCEASTRPPPSRDIVPPSCPPRHNRPTAPLSAASLAAGRAHGWPDASPRIPPVRREDAGSGRCCGRPAACAAVSRRGLGRSSRHVQPVGRAASWGAAGRWERYRRRPAEEKQSPPDVCRYAVSAAWLGEASATHLRFAVLYIAITGGFWAREAIKLTASGSQLLGSIPDVRQSERPAEHCRCSPATSPEQTVCVQAGDEQAPSTVTRRICTTPRRTPLRTPSAVSALARSLGFPSTRLPASPRGERHPSAACAGGGIRTRNMGQTVAPESALLRSARGTPEQETK